MEHIKFGVGKKPLVIVPGLSLKSPISNVKKLEKQYSALKNHTIYIYDIRDEFKNAQSLNEYADLLVSDLKKQGIENADFLGLSMGGMLCQIIAVKYPSLVNKLVLASTAAHHDDFSRAVMKRWLYLAITENIDGLVSDVLLTIFSEKEHSKLKATIDSGLVKVDYQELAQFVALLTTASHFEGVAHLASIKCPTLVIGALGDKVFSPETLAELADLINCPLYMYDASYGHAVYDEALDFSKKLYEFFKS